MIDDVGVESPIPLPNLSSDILGQVLYYCKCYMENKQMSNDEDLVEALKEDSNECLVDAKFAKFDMDNLHDLIMVCIESYSY